MNIHPDMPKMLDIQDMERELKDLRVQAELVSNPLEKAKARRVTMKADLEKLRQKLDGIIHKRRSAEVDLAEAEARGKNAQSRQANATSTREVSDLDKMLEQACASAAKAEEAVLAFMEQEDEFTERLKKETVRVNAEIEKIDTEMVRLSTLLKEKQELSKDLREERIKALNNLDEEARENYEWLVNKHGAAQAVSDTSGGACGGCGAMLLPDQLNKVKDPSQLYRCTHCHRYLFKRD